MIACLGLLACLLPSLVRVVESKMVVEWAELVHAVENASGTDPLLFSLSPKFTMSKPDRPVTVDDTKNITIKVTGAKITLDLDYKSQFFVVKGGGALTLIGPLKLQHGYAYSIDPNQPERGGAIKVSNGNLTVTNVEFFENWASSGGAVLIQENTHAVFLDCDFISNHATCTIGAVN